MEKLKSREQVCHSLDDLDFKNALVVDGGVLDRSTSEANFVPTYGLFLEAEVAAHSQS